MHEYQLNTIRSYLKELKELGILSSEVYRSENMAALEFSVYNKITISNHEYTRLKETDIPQFLINKIKEAYLKDVIIQELIDEEIQARKTKELLENPKFDLEKTLNILNERLEKLENQDGIQILAKDVKNFKLE